jgi:hypothetical protein
VKRGCGVKDARSDWHSRCVADGGREQPSSDSPAWRLYYPNVSDVFSRKKRSEVMAAIRSTGNKETELRMAATPAGVRRAGFRVRA